MKQFGLVGAAVLAATAVFGCSSSNGEEDNGAQVQGQVGSMKLSLIGRGASGTTYVLRSATIMVQGPSTTQFFHTDEDPTRTQIVSEAPVGAYTAFLQEGWRLQRVDEHGEVEDVAAVRTSENPLHFEVFANTTTTASLTFRVGDDVVGMGAYELNIEVDETDGGGGTPQTCRDDSECGEGKTCCVSGFLGTCQDLSDGRECGLPDLTISAEAAQGSITIYHETFSADSCALVEGCIDGAGDRRLLGFDTNTPNIGTADMILGNPDEMPGFEFSACHNHSHFNGYAKYELLDQGGAVVATGHKQAFCLMDLTPTSDGSSNPRYHCGFQGISAGWADVYSAGIDCQWIDITGVPAGDYVISIKINTDRTLPESNYDNNSITVPVTIPEDGIEPPPDNPGDPLATCTDGVGGFDRNCGWQFAEGQQGLSCTPGESVTLGCGRVVSTNPECNDGTSCEVCDPMECQGDAVLRVCEGTTACTFTNALAGDDDSGCERCPVTSFTCPESGTYSVLVGGFLPGEAFVCNPSVVQPAL